MWDKTKAGIRCEYILIFAYVKYLILMELSFKNIIFLFIFLASEQYLFD